MVANGFYRKFAGWKTHCRLALAVAVPFSLGTLYFIWLHPTSPPLSASSNRSNRCTLTAHQSTGCSSSDLTVAFALIGRDVAGELPYVLANIQRLAAKFKRSHVVLVENDSADDTVATFERWAAGAGAQHSMGVLRVHSLPAGSGDDKFRRRDLRLLAKARNKCIELLLEPEFGDADFIIPVDTDMCFPWDVELQATVINNLLPSFGAEWHVLLANGVCNWAIMHGVALGEVIPKKRANMTQVTPWHPGSTPIYCDTFALRDVGGGNHNIENDVYLIPGSCSEPSPSQLGCWMLNGEAVIPVQAAFGGLGMYWAPLFRNQSSAQLGCRYDSTKEEPCEHVPLSRCIREVRHAKQLIASRFVVDWDGCSGPVRRDVRPLVLPWRPLRV